MKRAATVLVSLSLGLAPAMARAQSARPFLQVAPTYALPFAPQDFSDNWNGGLGASGSMVVPLSRIFALVGSVSYVSHAMSAATQRAIGQDRVDMLRAIGSIFDVSLDPGAQTVEGGSVGFVTAAVGARVTAPTQGPLAPYFETTAGMMRRSFGELRLNGLAVAAKSSDTAGEIGLGAGVVLRAHGPVGFFAGVDYLLGFTEGGNTGIVPLRFGATVRM